MKNMYKSKKALILTLGGSPEPLIKSINELKPEKVFFICSNSSVELVSIIKEAIKYEIVDKKHILKDYQSLIETFEISSEIIKELKNEGYDVYVDMTGGTKPMSGGLSAAAMHLNCQLFYVAAKSESDRDKGGLGVIKEDFGNITKLEDPFKEFALIEIERGIDFFNKYQFDAAEESFFKALNKISDKKLKHKLNIFLELTKFYSSWDKFKRSVDGKSKLEYNLKNINEKIIKFEELTDEEFNFSNQISDNLSFLNDLPPEKLKKKYELSQKVKYYIPDLLNNAERRISEGKYDDAVARLYRIFELISQRELLKYGVYNKEILNRNEIFKINKENLSKFIGKDSNKIINKYSDGPDDKNFRLALRKNYDLLNDLENDLAIEFSQEDKLGNELNSLLEKRNISILAHGLKPVEKEDAEKLFEKAVYFSKKSCSKLDYYLKLSKFPELHK